MARRKTPSSDSELFFDSPIFWLDEVEIKNEDLPYEQRDHALFVAFAPYNKPQYSISVVVEHGGSGSKSAAPIAKKVIKIIILVTYCICKAPEMYYSSCKSINKKKLIKNTCLFIFRKNIRYCI